MKKFVLIAVSAILTMTALVATGCAGTGGYKNNGYSYWETAYYTYEDGTLRQNFVELNFSPEDEYEVWINVSNMAQDNCKIEFAAGTSTLFSRSTATVEATNAVLTKTEGWLRLQTGVSSSYSYIDVGTVYAMHVNEIIVCSVKDGKVFASEFYQAGYRISRSETSNRKFFSEEELAEMSNGPAKTCDEQTLTFDRDKLAAAYDEATTSASSSSASN